MHAIYVQVHMDIFLELELEAFVTEGRALKVPFITLATKEPSCHAARQHKASRGKWVSWPENICCYVLFIAPSFLHCSSKLSYLSMPCGMCRTENMLSLHYISARFPNNRTRLKRSCRNTATRSFLVSMTSKLPAIRVGVAACCKLGKDHWLYDDMWNLGIGVHYMESCAAWQKQWNRNNRPCTMDLGHRKRDKNWDQNSHACSIQSHVVGIFE